MSLNDAGNTYNDNETEQRDVTRRRERWWERQGVSYHVCFAEDLDRHIPVTPKLA